MTTAEAEALLSCATANPHAHLGAHPVEGGVVVRALRPGAEAVWLLVDGDEATQLDIVHPAGLFAGRLPGGAVPLTYELRVRYPDGTEVTGPDAYGFAPTLGEIDLHLIAEGRHLALQDKLGAHAVTADGTDGVAFAVWAPNARSVSVVGDFNTWDGRLGLMRSMGSTGVWELFVPGAHAGSRYKFELRTHDGELLLRADPFALETEVPPKTASVVAQSAHRWGDDEWMAARREGDPLARPMSAYEVHLGSWRLNPLEGNRQLTYRELADELGAYVTDLGFTHIELLPVMAHPFSGSWGYQVTSQFAPTPRHGSPDDLREFCDQLHRRGVGVILDWVPAHFPRDEWALARFDGTELYEHADPRRGAHPDWGTLIFNYGRSEVRNYLLSSALHWLRDYHADGLRVDAVASMLYLDYSRKEGEWLPNAYGGREDLDAVSFLRELNETAYGAEPGIAMIAEESTAWPGVSKPTYTGGLGFGFKWNLGWMHDTLEYFGKDPVHRRYHHHELTFSMMYAYSENFVLPLSHDEVVHGKGSLLSRMPGDRWQRFANLRALYGYMWAHPGKKLLFMGGEFGQESEWRHDGSLDWHLLEDPEHAGVQRLVADLNGLYREHRALWAADASPEGFWWLDANDAEHSILAWCRADPGGDDVVVCIANLTPVPRDDYRVGLPRSGRWREILNTDSSFYGGADIGNYGAVEAEAAGWHHQPCSATVTLPPLGVVWLVPEAAVPG